MPYGGVDMQYVALYKPLVNANYKFTSYPKYYYFHQNIVSAISIAKVDLESFSVLK